MIRFTEFSNPNGAPVGKQYSLIDGVPAKVRKGNPFASHCEVVEFADALELVQYVGRLGGNKHICAGLPRNGGSKSAITTKSNPRPGAITRTDADFEFNKGTGIGLLDHDYAIGRPRLDATQLLSRLALVLNWNLAEIPRIVYPSSSSFVECNDGTASTGLRGMHALLILVDASDWRRALDCIFRRLVIAGEGWIYIGADGRQHLRTLVDCTVSTSPSRQIYSGQAALGEGLRYSQDRAFWYHSASPFDTKKAIPPLSLSEQADYDRVVATLMAESAPDAELARAAYREARVAQMVAGGVSQTVADAAVAGAGVQRLEGPWSITLADGTSVTVDEILDAPAKFHNAYCRDPIEANYDSGRAVAKIYSDRGAVFISSWAHGGDLVGGPSIYVLERSTLDSFEILPSTPPAWAPAENAASFTTPRVLKADARDGTLTTRPLSEMGNALRLFDLFGDRLRYVPEINGWLVWEDGAWHWDVSGSTISALSGRLYLSIYEEGVGQVDGDLFAKWSRASQQLKVVRNAVALLAHFPQVQLSLANIDADTMLAGLDGARQVIDLRTGLVRAAEPRDFITKSLACDSVGSPAKAQRWLQFFDEIFKGDTPLINWVQRWLGYCLTGETREHLMVFGIGQGANGKSIMIEIMKHLMADYARAIDVSTLAEGKRQAGAASPDIAALIGARLVVSSETEDGISLAESLIKSLVSGDSMSARHLQCAPIEFRPMLKIMMLGNHRPIMRGTDAGLWRRFRLLPFTQTFSGDQRDPHLLEKLKAEGPDILAWLIQGCVMWSRQGLHDTPTAISSATASYRSDQDILGTWQAECTVADPAQETHAGALYLNYSNWCITNGVRPAANIAFGRRLAERGFVSRPSNGKRLWIGICLAPDVGFVQL